jgi:hypothetical protein
MVLPSKEIDLGSYGIVRFVPGSLVVAGGLE